MEKFYKLNIKKLAILSIMTYIILSIVFEESKVGLSSLSSIGMYCCLGCCFLYIVKNKFKVKINWFIISLIIFGIDLIFSSFYSTANFRIKYMYLYKYWTTIILLILIISVINKFDDVKKILNSYIIAGVTLAFYLYLFYGISHLSSLGKRIGNDLGNQNSIGISCAVAIIFSIIFLFEFKSKIKIIYIISIIICLPACIFTGSRKSILLIIMCVFVYFFSQLKKNTLFKSAIIIITFMCILWYILYNVSAFSIMKERIELLFSITQKTSVQLDTGSQNRIKYINDGWKVFLDYPIFGKGFCYSYKLWGVYSHNNYIELLMNNGIMGFCLYYFIHIKMGVYALKMNYKYKFFNSKLMIIILVILLFLDIGSVNFYTRFTLVLLAVCSRIMYFTNKETFLYTKK